RRSRWRAGRPPPHGRSRGPPRATGGPPAGRPRVTPWRQGRRAVVGSGLGRVAGPPGGGGGRVLVVAPGEVPALDQAVPVTGEMVPGSAVAAGRRGHVGPVGAPEEDRVPRGAVVRRPGE